VDFRGPVLYSFLVTNAIALRASYSNDHTRAAGYLALVAAYLYQFSDRESARKALDAMSKAAA
jgi:hypothetical protein